MQNVGTLSNSKKILIVDDDPNIVQMLKRALEYRGYLVLIAMDGEEALRKTEQEVPDLILLDLRLPRLPGEEVCKKIRSNDNIKNIPIIILTGKNDDADRIIGRVIGATYYMNKPCNIIDLLNITNAIFATENL